MTCSCGQIIEDEQAQLVADSQGPVPRADSAPLIDGSADPKTTLHRLDLEQALHRELEALAIERLAKEKQRRRYTPKTLLEDLEREERLHVAIVEAKLKLLALLMQDRKTLFAR